MKKIGIRFLSSTACALCLLLSTAVHAESVRIAVTGDTSLANLIDVTTSEVSKQPGLDVLERADLDKLGQEQEIQAVLDSKDFSPVRLLPADGLVLLRAVTKDGKTGVFARLVAVQPGVILREVALPDGADPGIQAQALIKEFAPYWSKLAAIRKGKITALSLLGLHFEVDSPETRDLERSINILLASRLSAEPDTLVLERWRLNDAVFEKTLAPGEPSPFWTGSSLIDGSMKWQNNRVEVTLRLRPSQGPGISIVDQDTPDNLAALVERLTDKTREHPSALVTWKPADEADHFVKLGAWCLDNRLFEEGSEAFESALALGDKSRSTHMLQVKGYAMEAFPDDLHHLYYDHPWIDDINSSSIAAESVPLRVGAAIQAARLTRDYMKANPDFTSQMRLDYISAHPDFSSYFLQAETKGKQLRVGTSYWCLLEDPNDLSLSVLNTCLRTLFVAYLNGFPAKHPDEMARLRHETQQLMSDIGGKLLPQSPSLPREAFISLRALYAGLWHENPEETIAFYREILNGDKIDGLWIRSAIFNDEHEPYLESYERSKQVVYQEGPPRVVAWDGRSPAEVQMIWKNFVNELAASSNPMLQCDSLKFEFGSRGSDKGRDEVLARFISFLQQHPDNLSGPRGDEFVAGLYWFLDWATNTSENVNYCHEFFDLYIALFKQHVALPPLWISNMSQLQYPGSSSAEPSLLAALNDYGQWYQTQTPQDVQVVAALARARGSIYFRTPKLAPVESTSEFLIVNHFWNQSRYRARPKPGQFSVQPTNPFPPGISPGTLTTFGNNIWFLNADPPHEVFCVNPVTLQMVASFPIPAAFDTVDIAPNNGMLHRYLEVTPQWFVIGMNEQVLLGSRVDSKWRALNLPPSHYKPRWVNQQLYLLYDAHPDNDFAMNMAKETSVVGSGLIRVTLPDGSCENLISSRRVPPQTALDGHPLGMSLDLWQTSAALHVAFNTTPIYSSPLGKNDWSPATTSPLTSRLKVVSNGALYQEGYGLTGQSRLTTLLNDSGSKILLSDVDSIQANSGEMPIWKLPQELEVNRHVSPIMRGDDLCVYYTAESESSNNPCAYLYYFAKGRKEGFKIPLAFNTSQIGHSGSESFNSPPMPGYRGLEATDYGLILPEMMNRGFWVIPWSDIDAYRAKLTGEPIPTVAVRAASPPVVTQAPVIPPIPSVAPTPVSAPSPSPITIRSSSSGSD